MFHQKYVRNVQNVRILILVVFFLFLEHTIVKSILAKAHWSTLLRRRLAPR